MTPSDSNGRLVEVINTFGLPAAFQVVPSELASPSRESVAFLTYQGALPNPRGATGATDAYDAERQSDGWKTARRLTIDGAGAKLAVLQGVSPDHLYSFNRTVDPYSPLSVSGQGTAYLKGPSESLELVGIGFEGKDPFAQGRYLGEGGRHVVFSTGHDESQSFWCYLAGNSDCEVRQLEPDAPPTGTGAVYDREVGGETRVVSLLPGEVPLKAGEEAFWTGTSKDGSSTAFEVENTLYIRLDNQETKEVAPNSPNFAGVSGDGGYVFYMVSAGSGEAGVIHRFDTATGTDASVDPGDKGTIVNVSGDGSHVYFISEAQLDGAEGTVGQPNLYVWSGGSPEYVTTVLPSDLVQTSDAGNNLPALGNWTAGVTNKPNTGGEIGPGNDSSRTTPDGNVIVFESKAKLTTYENRGHTEIYRYDESNHSLICVSCSPLTSEATKDAQLQNLIVTPASNILHNLSEDGSRVFFETDEALVPEDIDGINDAYEWSEEEGAAQLISSGKSSAYSYPPGFDGLPVPNVLSSITPDGDDVLFISQDALVPGAPEGGTSAIYDARVDGGFPLAEHSVCLEEGCKPPANGREPSLSSASSETLQGGGNVKPKKKHKHKHKRACHRRCARHRRPQARLSTSTGDSQNGVVQPAVGSPAENTVGEASGSTESSAQSAATRDSAPVAAATEPPVEFGIEKASAGLSTTAAGAHPDFSPNILLNHVFKEDDQLSENMDRTEEVKVSIPPGLLGNVNAVPRCTTGQLVAVSCPTDSQIGIVNLYVTWVGPKFTEPVYNLAPPHPDSEVARFGFTAGLFPTFIDVHVRTASDYGATATVSGSSGLVSLVGAETIFWGNPASPEHDERRLTATEATQCITACEAPGGKRPSTIPLADRKAFMTNPSACQSGQVGFAVRSYQLPNTLTAQAPLPDITNCTGLPFAPSLEARPTSDVAGAPTGLKSAVVIPQHLGEEETATATMREARVTLPEGMTINPAAADGLAACSDSQVHFHEEADAECPDASKLGTLEIKSPDLRLPLEGSVYQRSPQGKGHLFGLWLVSDELGLHVKIPGQVKPDPNTGRLTAVFSDLPQVPNEEIDLDIWGGARAPLKNPDHCGTYTTTSQLFPHSDDPPATPSDSYRIDRAPGGGPCPTSASQEPNSPDFSAGTTRPISALYSPLVMRLHREDASQQFGTLGLTLPPGLTGKLRGIPYCPEAALAGAEAKSGKEEQASPSCSVQSLLGTVWTAAGAGPHPYWVKGNAYLTGPYQGAPLSLAVITPAVAGPFDLGTVVVRSALEVNPETAQIMVKAQLPQVVEGVALDLRTVAVDVDREGFTLNGTSCEELAFSGSLLSTLGNAAPLQKRFQLAECARLGFKPKLTLALKGGTKRGDYPALTAVLKARRGDANIGRVSVALPHSEFLAQSHIGTICTRVQFAARGGGGEACPKGSIYGKVTATSPIVDYPLTGNVYLRSSSNSLPDLVLALHGPASQPIQIDAVGRIDSKNGGIRSTFETVPDQPLTKVVLSMPGGKKSLLENSTDICKGRRRVTVGFRAQNGRRADLRPPLEARCPQPRKHKRHHEHR